MSILKSHHIENKNIYRFIHVYLSSVHSVACFNNYPYFLLIPGISKEDSFKILSYLIDCIEEEYNFEVCSSKALVILNFILENYGFVKLNNDISNNINKSEVAVLYTVTGEVERFKNYKEYKDYFEWYTPNITFEEVKNIYKSIGVDISKPVLRKK